jgi:hydrogenase large subunit
MATNITLDPVTRLEGHLKIQVSVDTVGGVQQVVDAHATGTLFRGLEMVLTNRNPLDGPDITQRICGVCPVSHGLAASSALEAAAALTIPDNARIMRNLVLGSNFVQSHILHFYHLALQDFVGGPNEPPWTPAWSADRRFSPSDSAKLVADYLTALDYRRKAHEMGAIFGGRLPHPPTFVPGGFTTTPRASRIGSYKTYIADLISFISKTYIPDVNLLANTYSDYYSLGRGNGNLLAFGVFDLDSTGTKKLFQRGYVVNGGTTVNPVDPTLVSEYVTYSWYDDKTNNLPPAKGATAPVYPKGNAYSWLKAPRYKGNPYETGSLARMWVNGNYRRGISVIDRHLARAQEAQTVAANLQTWVGQLNSKGAVYKAFKTPVKASGYGLTEAPRGALGHWINIANSKISNYQVVTPTCWNASPRDTAGVLGPLEQALMGTPVKDLSQPIELARVVHSFDPCLACAVHVMRPGEEARVFGLSVM